MHTQKKLTKPCFQNNISKVFSSEKEMLTKKIDMFCLVVSKIIKICVALRLRYQIKLNLLKILTGKTAI